MKWLILAGAVAIAAWGGGAPLSGAPPDDSFNAGETLDFDLTWLGITGGALRMTIAPQPSDPTHYRLTSIAKSKGTFARIFSVRDEIVSYVNLSDFSTIRYEKHLNERGRRKDDITIIDEHRRIATRRRPGKQTQEISVTKPVFDPLSLVYHLRRLELTPGKVHHFNVFADGKLYTLAANVTGRERMETPAGTFDTVSVEPKMQSGGLFRDENSRMTIWYTDDARHIPVRIRSEVKVGTINALLRSVRAGVTAIEP